MAQKYRIEFSGKGYPKHRPHAINANVDSVDKAEKLANEYLERWKIENKSIKILICEIKEE